MSTNWHAGNAEEDGRYTRGWLVGHFIDPRHVVRSSKDVEIK
jgi:cbb3-type cytochrome oxidase cytochrome c subunit